MPLKAYLGRSGGVLPLAFLLSGLAFVLLGALGGVVGLASGGSWWLVLGSAALVALGGLEMLVFYRVSRVQ